MNKIMDFLTIFVSNTGYFEANMMRIAFEYKHLNNIGENRFRPVSAFPERNSGYRIILQILE